jgi:hypothetical protein
VTHNKISNLEKILTLGSSAKNILIQTQSDKKNSSPKPK